MKSHAAGPVTVFKTNDPALLAIAQSLLQGTDIDFIVAGAVVSGLYPGGATGPYGAPEIRVPAENADEVVVVAVMRLAVRKRPLPLLRMLRAVREQVPAHVRLRAVIANGDFDDYWRYHLTQERHRVHETRYAHEVIPQAA